MLFNSCFPHIVNLACKAALAAITDLTYIDNTIEGYLNYDPSFTYAKNCIATVCSLVNAVNYISIHSYIHILIDNINRYETAIFHICAMVF